MIRPPSGLCVSHGQEERKAGDIRVSDFSAHPGSWSDPGASHARGPAEFLETRALPDSLSHPDLTCVGKIS